MSEIKLYQPTEVKTCSDCPTPNDCERLGECQWGEIQAALAIVHCYCQHANIPFNECAWPNCDKGDEQK